MIQEYTQEMKYYLEDALRDIHTMLPGRIVSFDPRRCEATVAPIASYKKLYGETMPFPQLFHVSVYTIQGAGQTATIAFPVNRGDQCILFFSEQALDAWRNNAESSADLRFDLSNAYAVVGMFSRPNGLVKEACVDNAIIIQKDGSRVKLKEGEITISDSSEQSIILTPDAVTVKANDFIVQASGNITMTGARIDLN